MENCRPVKVWRKRLTVFVTGFAAVADLGDAPQLLDQRAEQFSSSKLVLAGPTPATSRGQRGGEAEASRGCFTEAHIEQLDLPSLVSLQLRNLQHMSIGKRKNTEGEII